MCWFNAITKAFQQKTDHVDRFSLDLMKQRQAVANRNAQTTETIKDNTSNNVKRGLASLRVPLLNTFGTGTNLDGSIGLGLNLGGNQ